MDRPVARKFKFSNARQEGKHPVADGVVALQGLDRNCFRRVSTYWLFLMRFQNTKMSSLLR